MPFHTALSTMSAAGKFAQTFRKRWRSSRLLVAFEWGGQGAVGRGSSVRSRRFRLFAVCLGVATMSLTGIGLGAPAPAFAVGSFSNAALADLALTYVGQWGGNATAGTPDAGSGQCRAFANAIVARVSGGTMRISYGANEFTALIANGVEQSVGSALKGDVIQWPASVGLHTAIVVSNLGGGNFDVVDSNMNYDEIVRHHTLNIGFRAGGRIFRLGQASAPTADGSFIRDTGNNATYRMAGGAPIYVSTWDVYGGPQPVNDLSPASISALPQYPRDGTYIRALPTGEIFRMAGGAPMYVSNWANLGVPPQPSIDVDKAAIDRAGSGYPYDHLRQTPVDMFLNARPSGAVYRVVSGHAYWVPTWADYGGTQPYVDVDEYPITHCYHVDCNPWGSLDTVSTTGGGVLVTGWAMDPNAADSLTIHVYADGSYVGAYPANKDRGDVESVFHRHQRNVGFASAVPLAAGTHQVCVYAINIGGGNSNTQLGCKSATAGASADQDTSLTAVLSRRSIVVGSTVIISGRLTAKGASTVAHKVTIWQRRVGSPTWTVSSQAVTSTSGTYSMALAPMATSSYRTTYSGDAITKASSSNTTTVAVAARITAGLSKKKAERKGRVWLSGVATPAHGGSSVFVQRYRSRAWVTVATVRLTSRSAYRWKVPTRKRGTFLYRVVLRSHPDHLAGVSEPKRLEVG